MKMRYKELDGCFYFSGLPGSTKGVAEATPF